MEVKERINNRLTTAFKEKGSRLLNIYFTAGFPELNDTLPILKTLEKFGVDMVEIGMPFSDPMADGPVIQHSGDVALENGMKLSLLFEQLKDMRKEVKLPVLLMGYLNPVMQYGIENFCKKAAEVGVDGLIIPDIPLEEFQEEYREIFERYNLSFIFLVTPQTSEARVRKIDDLATGFIYVVSTSSTTGGVKSVKDASEYLKKIQGYNLQNPTMVGFNIKDKETFEFATNYANGAIIGSAFINMLNQSKDKLGDIEKFVKSIR